MSSATQAPDLTGKTTKTGDEARIGRDGPGFFAQAAALLLSHSRRASARERAAVMQAAARGNLSEAMDAMLAWAISEQRQSDLPKHSNGATLPPSRPTI